MTLSRIMRQSWWACRERTPYMGKAAGLGRFQPRLRRPSVSLSAAEWFVEEAKLTWLHLIGMGLYQAIATAFREDQPFRGDCSTLR